MAWSWRGRSLPGFLLAGLVFAGLLAGVLAERGLLAGEGPAKDAQANLSVRAALREGLDGRLDDRNRLLREALEAAPDLAAAHWHLGQVKLHHKWVPIADIPALAELNPKLTRYRAERAKASDTAAGQIELANWCAKQGLADEERAHLTRVLVLEPEHPQARARLGFRMAAGQWISKEQQDLDAARQLAAQQGLKKWEGKVQAIRKGFSAEGLKVRQTALERARAIDDPAATPALEHLLASEGEQSAMLAVDVISKFKGPDAARALSRLAVSSPWQVVRTSAAQGLKGRPQDSYVPSLLATLYMPVETRSGLFQSPDGRYLYRHLFYREGQDQKQIAVFDTEYRYVGGDGEVALSMALMAINSAVLSRELAAAGQNRLTGELNDRIFRTLSIATEESVANDSEAWWKWWADTTEVLVPHKESKESRQFYARNLVDVAGPTSDGDEKEKEDKPKQPTAKVPHEFKFYNAMVEFAKTHVNTCLAAGTLVTTEQGLIPIEKIQIGDRVLSQDPKTGELTYKPVLRTTITRARRLVKVSLGYETIEATGGHLFWEPGKGWVKASQLKAESKLHQPTGTAMVEGVEEGRFDFTYNLVVADFHTYFVGRRQVLCHDVTRHESTEAALPGLER